MIKTIGSFVAWVFWNFYYVVARQPKDLDDFITIGMRKQWPWWKFKPCLHHNEDGKQWEIRFTDEESFSVETSFSVTCHIGNVSKQIVGFTVWDSTLEHPERHLSAAVREEK